MLVLRAVTVALLAAPLQLGRPACKFAVPVPPSSAEPCVRVGRVASAARPQIAAVLREAATRRGCQRAGVLLEMCSAPDTPRAPDVQSPSSPQEQEDEPTKKKITISAPNLFYLTGAKTTPDVPLSNVGVDGGDVWSGLRLSGEELMNTVDEALSMTPSAPIIAQYYPGRRWLLAQWTGTVVKITLPREVLRSVILASVLCVLYRVPPISFDSAVAEGTIAGIAKAWTLSATMGSFMLSFFLSQSYTLWRNAYAITRRIQGALHLSLHCLGEVRAGTRTRTRTRGQRPKFPPPLCRADQ